MLDHCLCGLGVIDQVPYKITLTLAATSKDLTYQLENVGDAKVNIYDASGHVWRPFRYAVYGLALTN